MSANIITDPQKIDHIARFGRLKALEIESKTGLRFSRGRSIRSICVHELQGAGIKIKTRAQAKTVLELYAKYVEDNKPKPKLIISVKHDESALSPREDDNACTMICWHKRYDLGDKHDHKNANDLMLHLFREITLEDAQYHELIMYILNSEGGREYLEAVKDNEKVEIIADWMETEGDDELGRQMVAAMDKAGLILKPLHLYDHSGITISLGTFNHVDSAGWDWGTVGFIYITPAKINEEWVKHGYSLEEAKKNAEKCMEAEVETYDHYITGQCYGYDITDEYGDDVDSCWGFIGEDHLKGGILDALEEGREYEWDGLAKDWGWDKDTIPNYREEMKKEHEKYMAEAEARKGGAS